MRAVAVGSSEGLFTRFWVCACRFDSTRLLSEPFMPLRYWLYSWFCEMRNMLFLLA